MQKVQFLPAIAAVLFLSVNPRAMAELVLPEGPNRDFVTRTCTACHDLGMVLSAGGRTREGWSNTLDDMTSYGSEVTAQERARILDYLATYLPPQ